MTEPVVVQITRAPGCEDVPLPAYESELAAGVDIRAAVDEPMTLAPGAHSFYFPHAQWSGRQFTDEVSFVVRTKRPANAIAEPVRQALLEIDADLDVQVSTLGRLQRRALVTQRLPAGVTASFAAIAILLSGLGIYGLLALSVKERTNEIGVRLALGASRASVLALVVRRLAVLSTLGLGAGFAAALLLGRFLDPLLTEVDATAPGSFALGRRRRVGRFGRGRRFDR